jgi:DNA-binding NarL/FixJ family response regulator
VVATGTPIEDKDRMLNWIGFVRPFFDVCGAQLRNVRLLNAGEMPTGCLTDTCKLTEREKTVLRLIARGLKDIEIASQCNISVATVVSYKKRIAEKTGRRTKLEMARYAHMIGLMVPE